MSSDRLHAPDIATPDIQSAIRAERERCAVLVADAFERGARTERARCADIAALYPLQGFCWDERDIGIEEVLRLRDTISEAILKNAKRGERII